jgi:hypothetical protein
VGSGFRREAGCDPLLGRGDDRVAVLVGGFALVDGGRELFLLLREEVAPPAGDVLDVVAVRVPGRLGQEATAGAGVGTQVEQGFEVFPVVLVELGFRLAVEEPARVVVVIVRAGFPAVESADGDPEREGRLYLAPFRRRLRELAL